MKLTTGYKKHEESSSKILISDGSHKNISDIINAYGAMSIAPSWTFSNPISADLLGNATTADRLKNTRTITIGSKSNTFDGSGDISFTLALIGAQASGSYKTTLSEVTKSTSTTNNFLTSITLGTNGNITSATFTALDTSGTWSGKATTSGTADLTSNSLILKIAGGSTEDKDLYTFNGSAGKTINFKAGTGISFTTDTSGNFTITNSSPDLNHNTDVNVSQTATDSTDATYEVLFSSTADNTTRTEGARKTQYLTYNPSTKLLTLSALTASGAVNLNGSTTIDSLTAGNLVVTGASTLTGSVSLGTVTSGVWNGTTIGASYLPTANGTTLGIVKTTDTSTSTSGYTACRIINGVVYYKNESHTSDTYTGTVTSITPGTGLTGASSDVAITSSGTINLLTATTSEIGGIKIAKDNSSYSVTTNTSSISANVTSGKYYGVEIDSNDKAFVYVPWTNSGGTVTSVATGTGLTGGTITSSGTISINSTYLTYISHGESAYNSLSDYVTIASALTITGTKTFSNPISGDLLGNATTADRLKNARTINGVSFDGSGNITITAAPTGYYQKYPYGFSSFTSGATWGNTTGTSFACWNDSTGGSIDFRRDNPSSGKMSLKVDGRVYVNEGTNPCLSATSANGYWGMSDPDGASNVWIRTTSLGILPYLSGSAGSGHNSIGTSSWYFSTAYIDTVNAGKCVYVTSACKLEYSNECLTLTFT